MQRMQKVASCRRAKQIRGLVRQLKKRPSFLAQAGASKGRKTCLCPRGRQGTSLFPHITTVLIFLPKQSTVLKQAGKVSSWVIGPRQWNSAFKTTTTKYVTMYRANEGKKHSVKASLELSHCRWAKRPGRALQGHASAIRPQRQAAQLVLVFSWFYMSSATLLSVSVFILNWFCCISCLSPIHVTSFHLTTNFYQIKPYALP